MSPRDKALAELLDELADYVLAPEAVIWNDPRAVDEQRQRAIRVQVLLESTAGTLTLSPAELFESTCETLRKYSAQPLRYEPCEATPG